MRSEEFVIFAKPVPKGSRTNGFTKDGRSYSREANKHVGPWMKLAKEELRSQASGSVLLPPYEIDLRFYFVPPKVPSWPRTGDLDKYARAVLDALTQAEIIEDDRHVVKLSAVKLYGSVPRTEVTVSELSS